MDANKIKELVMSWFNDGNKVDLKPNVITVHPNGVVDINGSIGNQMVSVDAENEHAATGSLSKIPLQFGVVTGNVDIGLSNLVDLKGCPHTVGGDFSCNMNELHNLVGGPRVVGGVYSAVYMDNMTNLDGLPESIGMKTTADTVLELSYSPNLPLLRIVLCEMPAGRKNPVVLDGADANVNRIIKKYVGQPTISARRAAGIQCQIELISNGFDGNARLR